MLVLLNSVLFVTEVKMYICTISNWLCVCVSGLKGLHRRATPHPSELKVMKKVIEERRNEAYSSRPDGEPDSPDHQVGQLTNQQPERPTAVVTGSPEGA